MDPVHPRVSNGPVDPDAGRTARLSTWFELAVATMLNTWSRRLTRWGNRLICRALVGIAQDNGWVVREDVRGS